jgi:hypothetical protein
MPIFERDGKKIHFIHIPKTGGKSIRAIFGASGWREIEPPVNIADTLLGHNLHMPWSHWSLWEETKNCNFEFTVVRNPISRMNSLIQMWLRSFYFNEHSSAYHDGGTFGPGMRKFFVDHDVMQSGDSNEVLHMWVANITWPDSKQHQQEIAQANGISVDQMQSIIVNNLEALMRSVASKNIERLTSKSLKHSSWIDLLTAYMNSGTFAGIEREGLTPCPMSKYVSGKTCIYRFEDFDQAMKDLVDRGYLNPEVVSARENSWPALNTYESSSWSVSEDIRSRFYELYDKDFEIFEYEKNTPFPGQKLRAVRSHPMSAIYASD